MSSIFDPIVKRLQEKLDLAGEKLCSGGWKDETEARVLVERRKSLQAAIDIVKEQTKQEETDDE